MVLEFTAKQLKEKAESFKKEISSLVENLLPKNYKVVEGDAGGYCLQNQNSNFLRRTAHPLEIKHVYLNGGMIIQYRTLKFEPNAEKYAKILAQAYERNHGKDSVALIDRKKLIQEIEI